ncbi:ESX secretion-associated protein EspG [Nocardia aurea]|uniref:ESX secretion-associated protein EspG n=1 Tax=Nocardia aurea TaxID=2144174 RepID=A0ABV3FQR5_9NOCA
MSRTWNFTDLEFFVLWERAESDDEVPSPLTFTSRTAGHDDFIREKIRTREVLSAKIDDRDSAEMLDTLAFPDIRVVVDGWGAQDMDDPKGCVRLLAGRKGDIGYLVKQLPGETIWHSSGFVITECSAVNLAKSLVAEMPALDAGKLGEIMMPVAERDHEVEHEYGASLVEDSFDEPIAHRSRKFLEAPAITEGIITVVQGRSIFGPRGITRHQIEWRDLVDDGRYAIIAGVPPRAVGADAVRLTTLINAEIASVIRAIKDERR